MTESQTEAILRSLIRIEFRLFALGFALRAEQKEIHQMATALEDLQAAAALASGDPAQLEALSKQLGDSTAALAAAITANTPAATAPAAPTP